MATADRKRKRETNEEENTTTMDTEQSSTAQFPQINPSQLQVTLQFERKPTKFFFSRMKPMVFVKFPYLVIGIHH